MDPCEINVAIMAITNHLYCELSKEDFAFVSIFLNELSKSMFTTAVFRDLNEKEDEE